MAVILARGRWVNSASAGQLDAVTTPRLSAQPDANVVCNEAAQQRMQ